MKLYHVYFKFMDESSRYTNVEAESADEVENMLKGEWFSYTETDVIEKINLRNVKYLQIKDVT